MYVRMYICMYMFMHILIYIRCLEQRNRLKKFSIHETASSTENCLILQYIIIVYYIIV